jgi:soluble lytic murein transglycosylase
VNDKSGNWQRQGAAVSENLARRSRRHRLIRLVVYGVVLVAIAIVAALIVTGRTVVPVVSERIYPVHYREEIARVAEKYDLNPYLLAAMAKTESSYDPQAVSEAGAVGLMQLMPETAEWITGLGSWRGGRNPDLTVPEDNLELGACYLVFLLGTFDGATTAALAAYNAGQGTVQEWVNAAGGADSFGLDDIRFSETREFVERVERYQDLYSRIYPDAFAGTEDSS